MPSVDSFSPAEIADIISDSRPEPYRSVDQIYMVEESMVKQAYAVKNSIENARNILFLGDGDGAGILTAMLICSHFYKMKNKNIVIDILDFDKRILDNYRDLYEKYDLKKNVNMNFIYYNVVEPPPGNLIEKYDYFYINPPYGSKNKGNSCISWIHRCLSMCKVDCSGCIIIPTPNQCCYNWVRESYENIVEFLKSKNFSYQYLPQIDHDYYLDDPNIISNSVFVETCNKIESEYGNENLPKSLLLHMYGLDNRIPKSIDFEKIDYGWQYGREVFWNSH